MAQAPATPKWRRLALRALARHSIDLAARLPMAESEAVALSLRRRLAREVRPAPQEVRFLIPLVGPGPVRNWDAVTDRLAITLRSLREQDDPRWRAVICCQSRPPLPRDARIGFLPFDGAVTGNDKWAKLGVLCDHLPRLGGGPGYVMSFDADDLLRQGTVRLMLTQRAARKSADARDRRDGKAQLSAAGWLARSGFVQDHESGVVALADAPDLRHPLRKPFWKLCGSCAALWTNPAWPECVDFLKAMTAHEHRMFPHLAALAGLPLTPLPRPSLLYSLNHGENFGARRGRVGFKTRFVERYRITDAGCLDGIARDFPNSRSPT